MGSGCSNPRSKVPAGALKGANGAGDAFAAGFLYGVHEGWAYGRCLELAHASAAACIRTPGTYDGLMPVGGLSGTCCGMGLALGQLPQGGIAD